VPALHARCRDALPPSLLASAKAYTGRASTGAVLIVPEAFNDEERAALTGSAETADVGVL
jgi:molecular chaperone DnaK (HSP70)